MAKRSKSGPVSKAKPAKQSPKKKVISKAKSAPQSTRKSDSSSGKKVASPKFNAAISKPIRMFKTQGDYF